MNRTLLKSDLRDVTTLVFTFLVPLVLLVALAKTYGSIPNGSGGNSIDLVSSNVVAFGIAYTGIFAGAMHLATWRENGMFQVLRAFPISTGAILLSQAAVGALLSLAQAVVILGLAATPLIGMHVSLVFPVGLLPLLLGYLVFFFIGVLLASLVPSVAAISLLSNLVVIPLGFAGGAMLPIAYLPTWVQTLAPYTPIYYLRQALYVPLISLGNWSDFGLGCLYLAVIGTVLYLVTRRVFVWR